MFSFLFNFKKIFFLLFLIVNCNCQLVVYNAETDFAVKFLIEQFRSAGLNADTTPVCFYDVSVEGVTISGLHSFVFVLKKKPITLHENNYQKILFENFKYNFFYSEPPNLK